MHRQNDRNVPRRDRRQTSLNSKNALFGNCIKKPPFKHYLCPHEDRLTAEKAIVIYILGGTLGTLWEVIFNLILLHRYVECSGSVFTPFNPVYGCGALVIVLFLRKIRSPLQVFVLGAFAGGAVEYFLSYCEETILGTRSWNYEKWLMDINGRTTVPIMIIWGILCVAVVFLLYRPLNKGFCALPRRAFRIAGMICIALVAIDFFFTVSALVRYVCRADGIDALTAFGNWIDTVFPDTFMKKRFPSMRIH